MDGSAREATVVHSRGTPCGYPGAGGRWAFLLIWNNPGASLACQGLAYCFRHGNERGPTTLFEIIDDGANFGTHTALREMPLVVITFGLAQRDGIQVTLLVF